MRWLSWCRVEHRGRMKTVGSLTAPAKKSSMGMKELKIGKGEAEGSKSS
jgi:hypothetical protein